ncbi:MAG: hypothetical protein U0935_17925 [Pirellulales bacterium]
MARDEDRQAEWRARLARWPHSGRSIRRFGLGDNVSELSFYRRGKRLRVADATERLVPECDAGESRSTSFLPVEVIGGSDSVDH